MLFCFTLSPGTCLLAAGYLKLVMGAHWYHYGKEKVIFSQSKNCLLEAYDKLSRTNQQDAAVKLGDTRASLWIVLKQQKTVMDDSVGDRNQSTCWKQLRLKPFSSSALIMPTQEIRNSEAVCFITLYSCNKNTNANEMIICARNKEEEKIWLSANSDQFDPYRWDDYKKNLAKSAHGQFFACVCYTHFWET